MTDKVKLNKHYVWDILEIAWSEVKGNIYRWVPLKPDFLGA